MTTTTAPAARHLVPAIAQADAAFEAWKLVDYLSWSATPVEFDAWTARRDARLAQIASAEAEVQGLLCRRCNGRGRFVAYTHRCGGICYQCKGDGWTAKGRRAQATPRSP